MKHSSHENLSRSRDIRYAQEIVQETPEIREERVAAAKLALRNGTLTLRGKDLADKLLNDPLHSTDMSKE